MEQLKPKFQKALDYASANRSNIIVYAAIIALVVFFVALFIYNNPNKVVYQPAEACKLFTPDEAQKLLDDDVISTEKNQPVISGNTATSKCSYTDRNPDSTKMKVAAVAVRSGINDDGVTQNKAEFTAGKPTEDVEIINNLGDDAYFNKTKGQLNVLAGKNWYLLSYGAGNSPEKNSVEDAVKLARLVL